jgi:hypothetical protein
VNALPGEISPLYGVAATIDRLDFVRPVDCSRYAIERRDFARQRVHAKCFGAGSDKDGRAALFFARKREGEFNVRPRIERNV